MRKPLILLFVMLGITNGHGQKWQQSIEQALAEAEINNKKILLFFSVSEQCDNCVQLEKNVFSSDAFIAYANENYILVKMDFSDNAETATAEVMQKNLLIIEKYNKDGFFPLVVVLNKDLKVLGKTGLYENETPDQFISQIRSF